MALAAASSDEQAVRAALDKFNEAARNGDAASLDKLLSADLMYAHSNALVEDKAQCIAALVKGRNNFVIEPGLTVKVYGKTGVVHGKMTANPGKPNAVPLHFLQVWVKDGGGWKMAARHTTRLTPAK